MPNRFFPSRTDTDGFIDDMLRVGVRMIPCISKPVPCCSLTLRNRWRSSQDMWS